MKTFYQELKELINRFNMENGSDTPDFVLARYLKSCLDAFDLAYSQRSSWYQNTSEPVSDETVTPKET